MLPHCSNTTTSDFILADCHGVVNMPCTGVRVIQSSPSTTSTVAIVMSINPTVLVITVIFTLIILLIIIILIIVTVVSRLHPPGHQQPNPYDATLQLQLLLFNLTALAWASLSMTPLLDRSASRNTARLRSTCIDLLAALFSVRWKNRHCGLVEDPSTLKVGL